MNPDVDLSMARYFDYSKKLKLPYSDTDVILNLLQQLYFNTQPIHTVWGDWMKIIFYAEIYDPDKEYECVEFIHPPKEMKSMRMPYNAWIFHRMLQPIYKDKVKSIWTKYKHYAVIIERYDKNGV